MSGPVWTIDHTWGGLIIIRDETGKTVATLEKHASGTPGSGIPVKRRSEQRVEHGRPCRLTR